MHRNEGEALRLEALRQLRRDCEAQGRQSGRGKHVARAAPEHPESDASEDRHLIMAAQAFCVSTDGGRPRGCRGSEPGCSK